MLRISDEIKAKIDELESMKKNLELLATEKARSSAEYEKTLAVTIMALRNGKKFLLSDETIVDPPVSIIEKIAKGICWEESIKSDMAESAYKNSLQIINMTEAQLNGFQSINRHLSEA